MKDPEPGPPPDAGGSSLSVSVVVPVRDRQEFLEDCLRSAFAQDVEPFEVLVVDDGSTVPVADRLQGFDRPLRVIRQAQRGRSAARNLGIRQSSGALVAFLDSDDRWTRAKLAAQVCVFLERPDVGIVAGHVRVIDREGASLPGPTQDCRRILDAVLAEGCSAESLVRRRGIFTSTVVVRREALEGSGLFDEGLDGNEDWDLWLRIARAWRVAVAPWPPVASYRVHGANTTASEMARGMITVASRQLQLHPPLPRRARAALLVQEARAHRTLLEQRKACGNLVRAIITSPGAAIASGAPRLAAGALLPVFLLPKIRMRRGNA